MRNPDDLSPVQQLARLENIIPNNIVNNEIEHLDACSEAMDLLEFAKLSVVAFGDEDAVLPPAYNRGLAQLMNHVQDKIQTGLDATDEEWNEMDTPFDDDDEEEDTASAE